MTWPIWHLLVPVSEVKYTENITLKKLFCNAHSRKEQEGERGRESKGEHLLVWRLRCKKLKAISKEKKSERNSHATWTKLRLEPQLIENTSRVYICLICYLLCRQYLQHVLMQHATFAFWCLLKHPGLTKNVTLTKNDISEKSMLRVFPQNIHA